MDSKLKFYLLAIILLTVACISIYYYRNYLMFSEREWKNNIHRSSMVSSILHSKILEKKSYRQAIDKLGEPSFRNYAGSTSNDSSHFVLVYLTGGGRYIDLESLRVEILGDTVRKVYVEYD